MNDMKTSEMMGTHRKQGTGILTGCVECGRNIGNKQNNRLFTDTIYRRRLHASMINV